MSTTIMNRADAVLVVVDVQERLAAAMPKREQVMREVVFLCKVAGVAGVDVVATRQYPRGLGEIEPGIREALAAVGGSAHVSIADKMVFDCFQEPDFCAALEATGRRQLLLTGMESHICVTQTALSARVRGYDVHVVADACCSRDTSSHEVAMARLRAAGVVVTVAESAAYELIGEAGTPEFKQLLGLVKARG